MINKPETISADDLCALTTLTDRRHRQLAEQGYFPAPVESKYQRDATLAGLFRFYREHNQRTKERVGDSKEEKIQKEIKLLALRIAREERKSIDRADVDKLLLHVSSTQKSVLFAALEREYPGKVVGRTAAEISILGRDLADRLCAVFQREVETWQTHD